MRLPAVAVALLVLGATASIGIAGAGPSTGDASPDATLDPRTLAGSSAGVDPATPSHSHPTLPACPPRAANTERAADPEHEVERGVEPVGQPRIVELYPNPTTHENVGEFVTLELPAETRLANWTLTDGHTTASLPNETVSGTVALSMDPDVTATKTDDPIVELEGHLRLSAEGDDLELREGNRTIDRVSYDRAPLADVWYRYDGTRDETESADDATNTGDETADPVGAREAAGGGQWWPREASCLPVTTYDVDDATTFVLPDSPEVPLETLEDATDRIRLAGYTITSEETATALAAAADRGVDVEVLLEAGPVGGTPETSDEVLTALEEGDVSVRTLGGEGARYRYHHPKYAVVDNAVLVTSENWKPGGTGGASSRGWGILVDDATLADDLEAVFAADATGWDTEPWESHREDATFVEDDPPAAAFPRNHDTKTHSVDSVELLLAPENADDRLRELLAEADESILVKQPTVAADVSLLEETLEAARRGVDVRLLLDSTWYVEDDNEALAADLEAVAAEEELSLEATLVDPGDRFEKIHAKGVVIDDETAVVGSANWNENSLENNREVLIVVHGEDAAAFYADVFEGDWDGQWSLPIGSVAVVAVGLAGAAIVARRYVTWSPRRKRTAGFDARGVPGADDTPSIPGDNVHVHSEVTAESETAVQPETNSNGHRSEPGRGDGTGRSVGDEHGDGAGNDHPREP